MSYTQLALLGVAGAVLVDTVLLRTWLVRRRTYWTAYAIVLFFQLVTNGILTGFDIVRYVRRRTSQVRSSTVSTSTAPATPSSASWV